MWKARHIVKIPSYEVNLAHEFELIAIDSPRKWYIVKTEEKSFDCGEMTDRGALRIYEETRDMTVEEELAYWRERQVEALKTLEQSPENRAQEH